LKSLGLKGPGLKLGVEKSRFEMSFNLENFFGHSGHGIPELSMMFIFGSVTMSNNLRMNGSLTTFEKLIS
jgi:hypothetical protein